VASVLVPVFPPTTNTALPYAAAPKPYRPDGMAITLVQESVMVVYASLLLPMIPTGGFALPVM
jgi:hypothetical protein